MNIRIILGVFVALLLPVFAHAEIPCEGWLPGYGRSVPLDSRSNPVLVLESLVVEREGRQTLYIVTSPGGEFPPSMGGRVIYALEDGQFRRLGADFPNDVRCIAEHNGEVYVGGSFPAKIMKWDGASWAPLPQFENPASVSSVTAIGWYRGALYAGFTVQAGNPMIAVLYEGHWTTVAFSPLIYGAVLAFQEFQGELIAAGELYNLNNIPEMDYIARYNGVTWRPMLTSMEFNGALKQITALTTHKGELIAGGSFQSIDGVVSPAVIRWDGDRWLPTGGGIPVPSYTCNALVSVGNALYQAGAHYPFSPEGCDWNFSRWTGGDWENPAGCLSGYDFNSNVFYDGYGTTLSMLDGLVVLGGRFGFLGSQNLDEPIARYDNLAAWNGVAWQNVTGAPEGTTESLKQINGQMYACADRNLTVTPIFRFTGSRWDRLPSGPPALLPESVYAIDMLDGALCAGGDNVFDSSRPVFSIWNGSSWSPPVAQPNDFINVIEVIDGRMYVSGAFTSIGGASISQIATWDGSGWHPLGAGLSGGSSGAWPIATFQEELVVGGSFTNSAGAPLLAIARWDGSQWSALGSGLASASGTPTVYALAEFQGSMYVGGSFGSAGGTPAANIARWDGVSWSGVPGPTLNNLVTAMDVVNDSLYIGGAFTQTYNGHNLFRLARFDGADWFDLDQGMSGYTGPAYVYSMEHLGPTLFIGGPIGYTGAAPHGIGVLRWGYEPISGDADADGDVDMADVCAVLADFNAAVPPGGFSAGDADRNRAVNFADITAILRSFGETCAE